MFAPLMGQLRVERIGPGRPRTRPDRVLGDKAYSSRANRALLRERGIKATIAEPADQAGHRKNRGRAGGRPPAFDAAAYKGPQRGRTFVQPDQGLARPGHPLRQARPHLP